MATVMHGRRKGKTKGCDEIFSAPPQQGNLMLPDGTDLRQVTVLPRAEWDRIQQALNRRQIEEQRILRKRLEHEELKQRSKDIVKTWGNTLQGQRAKKLEARRLREEKEEAERQQMDLEEAQYQAAQRKEAIDKAKTQQYYQTDRVRNFHRALQLTEALKERELQIELKRLKEEASKGNDRETVEKERRQMEATIRREQEAQARRLKVNRDNADFINLQIAEHLKERDADKIEDIKEGEELKKLSEAYKRETERLEKIRLEERKENLNQNKNQLKDQEQMRLVQELQEEEEDEECRIFAAAKRKMMRLRAEKERDIYHYKQGQLEKIREKLTAQMKQAMDDEDERIANAKREKEEEFLKQEEMKAALQRKKMADIAAHRIEQLKEHEENRKQEKRNELEQVQIMKTADIVFYRNEQEKSKKRAEDGRQRTGYLSLQMNERRGREEDERLQQLALDKANQDLLRREEDQFQEYAQKVIQHCEENGRNVYPLRKAAQEGSGGGGGPVFPGKGGIRPSYKTCDKAGFELPCYQRTSTENVKGKMQGNQDTKTHMGFVWC